MKKIWSAVHKYYMKDKKRAKFTLSAILILLLVISGTFAWIDTEQRKRNQAKGGTVPDVTLVNKYIAPVDWRVGEEEAIPIQTYVRYPKNGDKNYGQIAVRVQLSEHLEYSPVSEKFTEDYYEIYHTAAEAASNTTDAKAQVGSFVRYVGDSVQKVRTEFEKSRFYAAGYVGVLDADIDDSLKDPDNREFVFYVKSPKIGDTIIDKRETLNGQSGKPIPLGSEEGTGIISIVTGEKIKDDFKKNEDNFIEYFTDEITDVKNSTYSQKIREYVRLNLPKDGSIISEAEYNNLSSSIRESICVWIYAVDSSNIPWLYWSQLMNPGDSTETIFKTIELLKPAPGKLMYLNKFKLQAVTEEDMDNNEITATGDWIIRLDWSK